MKKERNKTCSIHCMFGIYLILFELRTAKDSYIYASFMMLLIVSKAILPKQFFSQQLNGWRENKWRKYWPSRIHKYVNFLIWFNPSSLIQIYRHSNWKFDDCYFLSRLEETEEWALLQNWGNHRKCRKTPSRRIHGKKIECALINMISLLC